MKKILALTALLALALVLFSSCGRASVNLANTAWQGSLYGAATELTFTETAFTLKAGDRVLGEGSYTLSGSTLTWNYPAPETAEGEDAAPTEAAVAASVSVQTVNDVEVLTIAYGSTTLSFTRK